MPVTIKLGKQTYQDDLHIYPGVSGALISWKAAERALAYCLQATHIQIIHNTRLYQGVTADEAKYFTVIDAAKGLYTTFITPFGCFKYLRAPYGLSSIAEHYNIWMAEAFEGLTAFRHIIDDVIII